MNESLGSIYSIIENLPPKGVSFSDFIAVFAMSIVGFFCLFFSNDFLLLISILSDICETSVK